MKKKILIVMIIISSFSYLFASLERQSFDSIQRDRGETSPLEAFRFPNNHDVGHGDELFFPGENQVYGNNPLDPSRIVHEEEAQPEVTTTRLGRRGVPEQSIVISSSVNPVVSREASAMNRSRNRFELPNDWCCSVACCAVILVGIIVLIVECHDGSCF